MRRFIYDGRPFALRPWGIEGALRWIHGRRDITLAAAGEDAAQAALRDGQPVAILGWDPGAGALAVTVRDLGTPDAAYIKMDRFTPIWQLESGWFQLEGGYRWTGPVAVARLYRPASARQFAVTVNVPHDMIRDAGGAEVQPIIGPDALLACHFTAPGRQTFRWNLPPRPAGLFTVRLESPPYRPSNTDPRVLGVAVVEFGFQ